MAFKKGYTSWLKGTHIQTNTGRTHFKKGHTSCNKGKSSWSKGKHLSPEHRRKIGLVHKGKTIAKWHKERIGKANKGKKSTTETLKKMSLASTGRRQSEEIKKKHSIALIKHYDKVGRKTFRRRFHHFKSYKYTRWRNVIFKRDDFKCVSCKRVGGRLQAHHIKGWAKYPKLRYKIENGITLCESCHKLIHRLKGYDI